MDRLDHHAFLTAVGEDRYLDLMPIRGADRGSFLVPVHAILRVRLHGDTLDVTPLSYDWFVDRVRTARDAGGLALTRDQKENARCWRCSAAFDWRVRLSSYRRESPKSGSRCSRKQ